MGSGEPEVVPQEVGQRAPGRRPWPDRERRSPSGRRRSSRLASAAGSCHAARHCLLRSSRSPAGQRERSTPRPGAGGSRQWRADPIADRRRARACSAALVLTGRQASRQVEHQRGVGDRQIPAAQGRDRRRAGVEFGDRRRPRRARNRRAGGRSRRRRVPAPGRSAGKNAWTASSSGRKRRLQRAEEEVGGGDHPRGRRLDTAVTVPPHSASTAVISPAGSACASEPTVVPRLRIVGCATSRRAWASSGWTRLAACVVLDPAVPGQGADRHSVGSAVDGVELADPVDVDQVRRLRPAASPAPGPATARRPAPSPSRPCSASSGRRLGDGLAVRAR